MLNGVDELGSTVCGHSCPSSSDLTVLHTETRSYCPLKGDSEKGSESRKPRSAKHEDTTLEPPPAQANQEQRPDNSNPN